MNTAEQNYRLLQEIEENRRFMLMAYQQNPKLLERAEVRIKQMFEGESVRQIEEQTMTQMTKQRGISLIELIMFIVIVSVALAGILLVMDTVTKGSADPLIHKQSLAIAESLLEEVELMPFTYCDPNDPNAVAAQSAVVGAGACTVRVEGLGPDAAFAPYQTAAETRYSATTPFDNVNDYNNFNMTAASGVQDVTNNTVLTGYDALVTMTQPVSFAGINGTDGNGAPQVLLINVTVTGPDNVPITLEGYRTRYAPNAVP